MQEEFHGIYHGNDIYTLKQLYNWGTINVNVWLPSLSELVGIDPNHYDDTWGTYYSAMQGLNTSADWYCVDLKGGKQFMCFQQYNASDGGQKLWQACSQQTSWLRSSYYGYATHAWHTTDETRLNASIATAAHAVHPAVETVCKGGYISMPRSSISSSRS